MLDGNNGNSAKITDETLIKEIEQIYESSTWKRGESSKEFVGVGFVIEFFEKDNINPVYKIDTSEDKFKYNEYFYSKVGYKFDLGKYRNILKDNQ